MAAKLGAIEAQMEAQTYAAGHVQVDGGGGEVGDQVQACRGGGDKGSDLKQVGGVRLRCRRALPVQRGMMAAVPMLGPL